MRIGFRLAMLGILMGMISGCTLIALRTQDKRINQTGFLAAQIEGRLPSNPVYALVLSADSKVLGSERVGADRMVTFALRNGELYRVLLFSDANENRRLDAGERGALSKPLLPVPLADSSPNARLVSMALGPYSSGMPAELEVPTTPGAAVQLVAGEVADLNEPRFRPETGTEGLWQPDSVLLKGQTGLYLTEPYDASKIPVVFVHGIGGSPQDFKKLIPALDRSRYQAWFFTYPSGFRLGKASIALTGLLDLTLKRYGVSQVYVVAHSMGGLVAREAILKLTKFRGGQPVGRFVSISTPWNGHAAAKEGVRHLRYPVPSWIDMTPGSEFLTALWRQKLPCPHWLIFGYDTKIFPWLTLNNDTVVDLESVLYLPAQEQAVRVIGLKYDHESILSAPETAMKMNEFLTQ